MEFFISIPEKIINAKNGKTPEDNVHKIVDAFKKIYPEAQFAEIFRNPAHFILRIIHIPHARKVSFLPHSIYLTGALNPETNKVEFFEKPSGKPYNPDKPPIKSFPETTISIYGNIGLPGDITITDEGNPEILFVERKDPSGNITKFQMNKMILLTFLYRLGASAFTTPKDN